MVRNLTDRLKIEDNRCKRNCFGFSEENKVKLFQGKKKEVNAYNYFLKDINHTEMSKASYTLGAVKKKKRVKILRGERKERTKQRFLF